MAVGPIRGQVVDDGGSVAPVPYRCRMARCFVVLGLALLLLVVFTARATQRVRVSFLGRYGRYDETMVRTNLAIGRRLRSGGS